MFQLIVAVVSVVLVAIIAMIAIWVGGQAFTSSGERALFTTYFNQGTQIEGALKLYAANNGGVSMTVTGEAGSVEATQSALNTLMAEEYLTHAPDPDSWVIEGTSIYRALEGDPEQCMRLNQFIGKDPSSLPDPDWLGCPPCNDAAGAPQPGDPGYDPLYAASTYNDWPGCRRVE